VDNPCLRRNPAQDTRSGEEGTGNTDLHAAGEDPDPEQPEKAPRLSHRAPTPLKLQGKQENRGEKFDVSNHQLISIN
jgi:hypothetical protein